MNNTPPQRKTMLAWAAWARALAILPVLALLWLAVLWAMQEVPPL